MQCQCGNHIVSSGRDCVNTNCQHTPCSNHSVANYCVCHFSTKNTLKGLEDAIKNPKFDYFYVGVSSQSGNEFLRYLLKPVKCTSRFHSNEDGIKKPLIVTTSQLDNACYWSKSSNLEKSEQRLLDYSYKFQGSLNDNKNAKKRSDTGHVYVRFYKEKSVSWQYK